MDEFDILADNYKKALGLLVLIKTIASHTDSTVRTDQDRLLHIDAIITEFGKEVAE